MMKQFDVRFSLKHLRGNGIFLTKLKVVKGFKMLFVAFTALCLQINAFAYSQNVSMNFKNAPIERVLKAINQQTGMSFLYSTDLLKKSKPITINVQNAPLKEVLAKCFEGQSVSFVIEDNTIVLKNAVEDNKPANTTASQQQFVEGTVVDEKGIPLQGVTVTVNEADNMMTITDANGHFKVLFPANARTITFTFIGYEAQTITVGQLRNFKITLSPESTDLDVVVVAYGTKKREEVTTAVSKISSKDFERRPITNISNAIAGAAPGVQSNSGNGAPGSGSTIRIRGFGTMSGSGAPLYVVDGAPYEGVINSLNPDDIESISILKDAASTSLYGARAANGIIMITTKKGIKNKTRIDIKAVQGFSERGLPNYERVNAYEYYPLQWESLRNDYVRTGMNLNDANNLASAEVYNYLLSNPFGVPNDQIVLPDGTINPNAKLRHAEDLDWRRAVSQTGLRNDYSVAISGGNDKSDFYTSIGYLKERGYTIKSDFERINARLKVNSQVSPWLKVGLNIGANSTKSQEAIENSGLNENPFYTDLIMGPIYYVHKHDPVTGDYLTDENGNWIYENGETRPVMTGRNNLAEVLYNTNALRRNALNTRGYATISFTRDLRFTTNVALDVNNYQMLVYDNPIIGDALGRGRTYDTRSTSYYSTINQLLNYDKTFGNHSLSLMAGHEYYHYRYDYLRGQKEVQIVDGSIQLENFTNIIGLTGYQDNYKLESYLARAEYDFNKRYFLSLSWRRDASSKFHPDNNTGDFYSASAAWTLSNEDFFNVSWVDNLKLRGSIGQVGSDDLSGYYLWQSFYNFGPAYNNGTEAGLRMSTTAGNQQLVWETTTSSDIAVEFGLFNSRLNGEIEYFHRKSDDLLFSVPTPYSSGYESFNDNIGSMTNRGIEITLSGDLIRHKNFKWNLMVNATTFKNIINRLPQDEIINGTKKFSVGVSRYEFWLREWYGVDPNTGSGLYYANALAGDAFINDKGDTVTPNASQAKYNYFGTVIPDVYGGITNNFTYKNWNLSVLLTYQLGGKVFDNDYQSLMHDGTWGRGLHVDAKRRWQNPGDITDVPKRTLGNVMYDSDRFLISGSYLTMRTVSLSYEFPRTFLNKFGAEAGRVYFTAENLFILAKRKGLNPTQVYTGSPSYTYAPARMLSFGLNVTL